MKNTFNDVLRTQTLGYLEQIDPDNPPSPATIEEDLLNSVNIQIDIYNQMFTGKHQPTSPGTKWPRMTKLVPWQIAQIVATIYPVCTICTAGPGSDKSYDLLAVYQPDGDNAGIYVTDEETFRKILRQYNITINTRDVQDAITILREIVPRKYRCSEPNLIAVNNGIFDYDTKTLMPFNENFVFLSKSRVDYNPSATNVVIHNPDDNTDWDIESWMNDLSDDKDVVNTLWEILGAIIRPLVSWNKSAWFYSETGNNGKGTLCELMRQLCGEGSYASIPLSDLGKDFMLEPLTRASAIIVDENDVGTFIDKAANLKAIITNDVIQINRKFKIPIPYKFYGFMVQCLNELPRVKDKSDSFFRRQLFVPFTKCFTGHERRYIKTDYLHRKEVLEYVLFKVLNMNYYTLSEPEACRIALEEYKEYNDPVRQFADDILPVAEWHLLPFTMLYEMYQAWFKQNAPSGKIQNRNTFINELSLAIQQNQDWKSVKSQTRGSNRMETYEPLLEIYNLTNWMNPTYKNLAASSGKQKCTPYPGQYTDQRFRGLVRTDIGMRKKLGTNYIPSDDDDDETEQETK